MIICSEALRNSIVWHLKGDKLISLSVVDVDLKHDVIWAHSTSRSRCAKEMYNGKDMCNMYLTYEDAVSQMKVRK